MISVVGALTALGTSVTLWAVACAAARRRGIDPGGPPYTALLAATAAGTVVAASPRLAVLCGALIAGTIDARTTIIPDPVTIATALSGLSLAVAEGATASAAAGAALDGAVLLTLFAASRGRGLGLGDVKLGATIGIGYGPIAGSAVLAAAFVGGAAYGMWLLGTHRASRRDVIPFGPFLAAGAWSVALVSVTGLR